MDAESGEALSVIGKKNEGPASCRPWLVQPLGNELNGRFVAPLFGSYPVRFDRTERDIPAVQEAPDHKTSRRPYQCSFADLARPFRVPFLGAP